MSNLQQNLQIIIEQLRGIIDDLETLNSTPLHSEPEPSYAFRVQLKANVSATYTSLTHGDVVGYVKHYRAISYDQSQMEITNEQTGAKLHPGFFWD